MKRHGCRTPTQERVFRLNYLQSNNHANLQVQGVSFAGMETAHRASTPGSLQEITVVFFDNPLKKKLDI
jgi:hypothetical protein